MNFQPWDMVSSRWIEVMPALFLTRTKLWRIAILNS